MSRQDDVRELIEALVQQIRHGLPGVDLAVSPHEIENVLTEIGKLERSRGVSLRERKIWATSFADFVQVSDDARALLAYGDVIGLSLELSSLTVAIEKMRTLKDDEPTQRLAASLELMKESLMLRLRQTEALMDRGEKMLGPVRWQEAMRLIGVLDRWNRNGRNL